MSGLEIIIPYSTDFSFIANRCSTVKPTFPIPIDKM
jgi:hypothetical protein